MRVFSRLAGAVCILLTSLLLVGCVLPVSQWERRLETGPLSEQGQEYYLLVNRLRRKDFSVDFAALRLGWTHTPEYLGGGEVEKTALADAYSHSQKGDYKRCLARAGEALIYNYTSLAAHNWAAFCADRLGLHIEAAFHSTLLDLLMQSILATGEGQSREQAWHLTGASELASLTQLLGLEIRDIVPDESLLRVEVTDLLEGTAQTYWADFSIPLARYSAARRRLSLPLTARESDPESDSAPPSRETSAEPSAETVLPPAN